LDIMGKLVVPQIIWIAMVKIEMVHERSFARPNVHFVLRITQMIGKTASKVTSPKDQDFGDAGWGSMVRVHGEIERLSESWGIRTGRTDRFGITRMI
jgi:hypothetical protein